MKVLITGATGLIGNHLVKHLLANGYTINFLTSNPSKLLSIPNCKGYLWNIKKGEINQSCFEEVSVIIHLAGASIGKRWSTSYKKEIIASRVLSANLIYNSLSLIDNEIKHFVSASAIGIYQHSFSQIHTEESLNLGDQFLATVVTAWEQAANKFSSINIKVTKIRTGLVLDQFKGAFPKMVNPIRYGLGTGLACGKQKMSWIHITDLVNVYESVIEDETIGIINAVSLEVVSNNYFMNRIANALHKKIWLPNVPKFMLYLLLGEMSILITDSQHVLPEILIKNRFSFKYPDLKSALKDLL